MEFSGGAGVTSQKTPPQGPAGERPSLFDGTTAAGPHGGQPDSLRMLSGLGGPGKPAGSTETSRRGWRVAAGAAVVVLAGVAAAIWLGGRPSAPGETMAKAAGPDVVAASAPAVVPADTANAAAGAGDAASTAPASASAATATAAAGPAVIEGVGPDAASAPAGSDPFAKMAAADTAAAASSPGDSAAAAAAPAASPVTASAHGTSKPHHAGSATRVAQADTPKRKPAANTQRRNAASAPDASKADSDVELLTALMAHLEGGVGASPTIAQLVRECRKLGGDQALQCRRRICDGYWVGPANSKSARRQTGARHGSGQPRPA
jgi:hypothetical protein